jgi:hypothetical protein
MFTNRGNISLAMSVWLASDDYDLVFDENTYSVTTLLQPTRSVILSRRLRSKNIKSETDLADIVPARLGSAVHTAVEVAWLDHREKAFKALGMPQHVADSIYLNADEESDPEGVYVYIEQRTKKEVLPGIFLSGKFDVVEQGRVQDVKTTKVYSWIKGSNNHRYMMQGSQYRYLNPEIITDDHMDVLYLFTDWSQWEAKKGGDYPPFRVMTKTLELMSMEDTETFVIDKIKLLESMKALPQEALPKCTPEELWQDPAKYAYYRNTKNKNATKLFDTMAEASTRMSTDAASPSKTPIVGRIDYRPAEPTFCKYCDALPACTQAEEFIEAGLLQL